MVDLRKKMKDAVNYEERHKLRAFYKIRHKKERKSIYLFADSFEDAQTRAGFSVGEAYFGGSWLNPYHTHIGSEPSQMPQREIREGRKARIPEEIIAKMSKGLKLSEKDKKIVRDHGKVYVPAFRKNNVITIRPQLRNRPRKTTMPKYLR